MVLRTNDFIRSFCPKCHTETEVVVPGLRLSDEGMMGKGRNPRHWTPSKGIVVCPSCGREYHKKSWNAPCPWCVDVSEDSPDKGSGRFLRQLIRAEARAKELADRSGNPRIWTSGDFSQEFLKSLVWDR